MAETKTPDNVDNVLVSLIIPSVRRSSLQRVLPSVGTPSTKPYEVIVVDDSSEGSLESIANDNGCRYERTGGRAGASSARNLGALKACGDILIFIDDDVEVSEEIISRIINTLESSKADAVVVAYGVPPPGSNVFSAYKHLWIMWSYQRSPDYIDWAFTSTFGIKRDVLKRIGGFDETREAATGTDDIDIGMRLYKAGARIYLDKAVGTTHLKRFTLGSLIRNQFVRSRSFTSLAASKKLLLRSITGRGFTNVPRSFMIGVILSWSTLLALSTTLLSVCVGIVVTGVLLTAWLFSTLSFLRFTAARSKLKVFLNSVWLSFIDHLVCGVGVTFGILFSEERKHTQ
jgi:GT2 family glycosyltransferase